MSPAPEKSAVPSKAAPVGLGPLSSGGTAFRSFTPTVLQVADRINDALTLSQPLVEALPLPEGMGLRLREANSQLQLVQESRVFTLRVRKVVGYIGSIELKGKSEGATSCVTLPLFPFLFFRYSPAVTYPSFPPCLGGKLIVTPSFAPTYSEDSMALWQFATGEGEQLFVLSYQPVCLPRCFL